MMNRTNSTTTPQHHQEETPLSTVNTIEPTIAHALVDNLKQQAVVYNEVLQVLIQKKLSILQHAIEELPQQDDTLRTLRKECLHLEREREGLQKEAWPHALEPVQATMIRMALPTEDRETYDDVRERLKRTLNQVQQIQQNIEALLHDSLQWVNQSIGMLTQHMAPEKSTLYTPQGVTRQPLPGNTLEKNI